MSSIKVTHHQHSTCLSPSTPCPGYSVRTPQYRYTEWVSLQDPELDTQQPDWGAYRDWGELYDLWADPNETNNLYRLDQWHNTKKMLRKILHGGWFEHN